MTIVLASTSATRREMLTRAGVEHEAVAPGVDEDAAKAALAGLGGRDLADALAELKALKVSARRPGDLVLGCDQTLELDDGRLLDKPGSALAEQLRAISGRRHHLFAGAVVAQEGQAIWRHVERVTLTVRPLSEAFIADYVTTEAVAASGCVGGYRVEALGAQLFTRIEGSHFAVLGLPLLPLLAWLRLRGELTA